MNNQHGNKVPFSDMTTIEDVKALADDLLCAAAVDEVDSARQKFEDAIEQYAAERVAEAMGGCMWAVTKGGTTLCQPPHCRPGSLMDEVERLTADLASCRGTVKTELHHYERLALVHGKTPHGEAYEAEAKRLSALLGRIDGIGEQQNG